MNFCIMINHLSTKNSFKFMMGRFFFRNLNYISITAKLNLIIINFTVNSPDSPLVSESSNTSSNSSGVASMSSHEEDKKSQEVLEIYQNVVRRPSEAGSSSGGRGLEESTTDTQKAIIEQMCHVVWRVLEKKQK